MRPTIRTLLGTAAICLIVIAATPAPANAARGELTLGAMVIDALSDEDVAGLRASGLDSARFVLSWDLVQRAEAGPFDWTRIDRVFARLAEAGVRALPVLFGSGPYRQDSDPVTPPTSKAALSGWKAFVRAAATRYGRGGEFWTAGPYRESLAPLAWEVWNEQNSIDFWPPKPRPRAYGRLLSATAGQLRRADPEAEVVVGGMFGRPENPASIAAPRFLRSLYAIDGSRRDFDAVGVHPYAAGVVGVRRQLGAIRRVIDAAGDRTAGIEVTEFGWGSVPSEDPKWADYTKTPEGQARVLRRSVRMMERRRSDWKLTGAYWFAWRDPATMGICPFCDSVGLLELDHTTKPSFSSMRKLATRTINRR